MIKIKKYQIEDYISDATQDALDLKADLVNGKVPASQLPSFVDDVIEVANYAALPIPGASGVIYITLDTNKVYRWSGSVYVEIASGVTNLSYTPGVSNGTVNSDTGSDATIPLAGTVNAGLFSAAEKSKLDGIAPNANVGVIPNAPITGATKTKITYDNKGLVTAGADATTADIADSTNKRYVTDANLTVINNTSGTNTGDQNLQEVTDEGATTTNSITANSFIKNGGTGTNLLLDNGSIVALSSIVGNTNLSPSQTSTNFTINSDTGTDATIPLGNGTLAGATLNDYTNAEKTKLSGIESGAEVNVNADWNATSGDAQILNKPTLTGFVPYTGATTNVDLGEFGLTTGQVNLDTTPTGTPIVGTTQWNDALGSSQTTLKGGTVILKNGVDLVARVVNKVFPNTTLTKAAYQAVRVSGATGQRLSVQLAQGDVDLNSADTIGLVTETIATNQEGFIITMGQIEDINTTGSLQGETWIDGDVLYLSPTVSGRLTNIKPTGTTGHIVVIGYVEYAHAVHGKIYVKIMNGWELDELHNVYINNPLNNEGLFYETSTQLWKNKPISTVLGYTPANDASVVHLAGDTMTGSLILNANPTAPFGAATKSYVDTLINGIDWKASANAATTIALPTYTLSGGGQILTGTVTMPSTDGVTLTVNQRLLVKNETSTLAPNNGIYVVTQVNPFILTRSSDANTSELLAEATISVSGGSTLANTQWHCNPASVPIVIGATNISFAGIGANAYSFSSPLINTSNVVSVLNASEIQSGVVTTGVQTFAGDKTFTGTTVGITKSMVGLSNVDDTSDVNKPISTATQTALNAKQDAISLTTTGTSGAATLIGATLNIPQYSGATNLTYTPSPTNGTVVSSTGDDATLPLADGTNAGLLKPAKFTVLENTSGTNTGDQDLSNLVVKNAAITAATNTKITYDAKGLVTAGANANLDDLGDVIITTPTLDQVLKYNGTNWVNGTGGAGGGVTTFSGGTTGLTPSTATSGAVTLAGTLNVLNGGTGSINASGARTNLGASTVGSNVFTVTNPSAITFLRVNANNTVSLLDAASFRTAIGATGTVTSVSVVSANGFTGTVATATSTPAITLTTSITGLLKGNGTAISAATNGTDYLAPNASITAATNTKITYDAKGLVTNGTSLIASDIPNIAQSQVTDLTSSLSSKENNLGLPVLANYVLTSTTSGVRGWIPLPGSGGGTTDDLEYLLVTSFRTLYNY